LVDTLEKSFSEEASRCEMFGTLMALAKRENATAATTGNRPSKTAHAEVVLLLPSIASVNQSSTSCPARTGGLAPTVGLYGFDALGSVSGASGIHTQLGLATSGGDSVTMPALAAAASAPITPALRQPATGPPESPAPGRAPP